MTAAEPVSDESLPLRDVRVIEMGHLIAGPFCGSLLADFGAEVIKIESPDGGDPMRRWGTSQSEPEALWWPIIGRNKKSVTIDLHLESGRLAAKRLIATADVVVENFRPGTLERWDMSYEQLAQDNPRMILARVSGFGQTGPYAHRAGYGAIGEAVGGIRYLTGDPGSPPSRSGISLGDSLAGMYACIGVLTALHDQRRTGRGQVIDVALYESVLSLMESTLADYTVRGRIRERTGAVLPGVAPSNLYPTADDQWILIAANQDTVFARLANVIGIDEGAPGRFATHASRATHQEELDAIISAWTAERGAQEILDLLEENSVPATTMYRAPEMLRDPHFAARDSIISLAHPTLGRLPMHNVSPRLSRTPGQVRWLAPQLGQHNEELLGPEADADQAVPAKTESA
ncbi:MAG: CaiB/BaiF CoA transferase family protein [Trebonia sp.]